MKVKRALIVGGGPAGMSAAIALSRQGVECEIAERNEDWRPAGFGIALRDSALRALDTLGLLDACVAGGQPHDALDVCDAAGNVMSRVPSTPPVPGPAMITMPRLKLHEILATTLHDAGVVVHLGTTVTALEQDERGVHVRLGKRPSQRFDMVVGADGLRSQMRNDHFPHASAPRLTGQTSWRAGGKLPKEVDAYYVLKGAKRTVGLMAISDDEMYLWMIEPYEPKRIPPRQLREQLLVRLAGFGPRVTAAAELLDGEIDARPLQALLLDPPWHNGRIVLIGDAAHTTPPHLTYGVGLAIEDAVVLAELVAERLEGDALGEEFAARRFERCKLAMLDEPI